MIFNFSCRSPQRQNFKIGPIQKLILDPDTSDTVIFHVAFAQQVALYTEYYNSMQMILTFKEEFANGHVGDPVLILLAYRFNISDVLAHNNVVLRFRGDSVLFIILTFRHQAEAVNFCNLYHGYFNPNIVVEIPPVLQLLLESIDA